jgi:[ribosomal protein S5]-alanine N-acetyltransferase
MRGERLSGESSHGESLDTARLPAARVDAARVDAARLYRDALTTPRLSIEPLNQGHAALLFEGLRDERIYEWISATPPSSVSALRERYARLEGQQQQALALALAGEPRTSPVCHSLDWALRLTQTGDYVGKLDAELEGTVASNVGYIIFPKFRSLGIATEALQALAAALERAGVVEQHACITRDNNASVRVVEKAHFRFTRVLVDNDTIRGQKFDDLEFVRSIGTLPGVISGNTTGLG